MSAEPGKRLISGIEPHWDEPTVPEPVVAPQRWRVYVGPRWAWKYVIVGQETGRQVYRAFHSTHHLYAGFPDGTEVHVVPPEERDDSPETQKKVFYMVEELMKRAEAAQ